MKVQFKAAVKEKDFTFQEGDKIKIITTSFLYATEIYPECVYEGKLVEIENDGFWAILSSVTRVPYSEKGREQGITQQLYSDKDEFFAFADVEDVISINDEYPDRKDPLIRFALDGPKAVSVKQIGRPSLGVTRKVSLTLPATTWDYLDSEAAGNRSEYLRKLIDRDMWTEQSWSNNACLGYAIFGAQKLEYSEEQIEQLVRSIYREFDRKSVDEAKAVYEQSPY